MSPKKGINSVIWVIPYFKAIFPNPFPTPPVFPFLKKSQIPIIKPPIMSGKKETGIPTPKKLAIKRINPIRSNNRAIPSIIILSNSIDSNNLNTLSHFYFSNFFWRSGNNLVFDIRGDNLHYYVFLAGKENSFTHLCLQ